MLGRKIQFQQQKGDERASSNIYDSVKIAAIMLVTAILLSFLGDDGRTVAL